jgi:hypothetical protein
MNIRTIGTDMTGITSDRRFRYTLEWRDLISAKTRIAIGYE